MNQKLDRERGRRWKFALAAPLVLALAALLLRPAWAQQQSPPPAGSPGQTNVSVALVLAVDCSFSVSMGRFELQKQGYAAAFRNPRVLNAIRSLGTQSIAVTMFQWTGPLLHVVVADWTLIKDAASANAFADTLAGAPRQLFRGGTSISGAIDYSRTLLAASPFTAARRTIDVSGDGSNNSGRPAAAARDDAVAAGIGINGLPILTVEPDLDQYYRDNVIGGPGAFMIPVANYDNFADAVLRKLINEIAGAEPGPGRSFARTLMPQTRPSLRRGFAKSVAVGSMVPRAVTP
jgi:hypothetical protein